MKSTSSSSPPFDGILNWLMEQGLSDASLADTVRGLGRRLVAGGVPVHRLGIGGLELHPVFGALDILWEVSADEISQHHMPRSVFQTTTFQNAPYFDAARHNWSFRRFRLNRPDPDDRDYPIFERLRGAGITEYIVFYHSYGRRDLKLWAGLPPGMEGAIGSFATRCIDGFDDGDVDYLRALTAPLCLVIKTKTHQQLTKTLLDTYLGRYSGSRVLDGLVERGNGQPIRCVLWYCDLRDSTALADRLSMDDYLAMLDAYFDCTAGAVLDHGGEVLKFVGDSVMAIFPFDDEQRPPAAMCLAALSTAREALQKAEGINNERTRDGSQTIEFGVAMHAGEVLFGNVGTDRRLDFTVIGPAANEVTRLEKLCKSLATPLLVSGRFAKLLPGELIDLGRFECAGVEEGIRAYTLRELAPPSPPSSRASST